MSLTLLALLVCIGIIVIVVLFSRWIIEQCKVGPPFDTIAMIVVCLVCLIFLLYQLGVVGTPLIRF